ncbi:zinc finger protein [Ophiostoma piceae UAMH 11346]|uniref:Zinc finger protein n=1 Tax=Ophiostoma piceae (strain UAMH 11346) TaxID=1262450 RepID=S3C047_OPHP1|nr:zinc finger protein [Ophiostoma piceae UAMH 11346]
MKRSREPEELPPTLSSLSPASPASPASFGNFISRSNSVDCAAISGTEQPRAKIASLSHDPNAVDNGSETTAMTCLLHREHIDFPTYESYEMHYNKEHLNRCIECRRNFPSPMYLSLHGDEWHNPFVAVKREKGEHTYACFVEGCDRKCRSMDKRRRHLIDKHSFPTNFFFLITEYGTDGRQSLLDDGGRRWQHRRRSSTGNTAKKEVRQRAASVTMSGAVEPVDGSSQSEALPEPVICNNTTTQKTGSQASPAKKEQPDVQMDDLAGAMSSMTFIPRSVRFGRGGGKAGFARR